MWIRNAIFHALRNTSPGSVAKISTNLVYEHPTIASLAQYASSVVQAAPNATEERESPRSSEELEVLLARYTTSFPKHVPSLSTAKIDVVLVTGTTGALGSAVLAKLVSSESVGKIFAYNRPSLGRADILERQKEALRTRGYDETIATSGKVTLVEGELTATGLGIDFALEEEVQFTVLILCLPIVEMPHRSARQSLTFFILVIFVALSYSFFTDMMNLAWRVDFNLRVSSFESGIGGVRTLVDLALSSPQPSPPRLLFASSVGVLRSLAIHLIIVLYHLRVCSR
jgi:Male sterility protein